MSAHKPKFGDVYKYVNDDQRVMVIGPTDFGSWVTITIRAETGQERHERFGFGVVDEWFLETYPPSMELESEA